MKSSSSPLDGLESRLQPVPDLQPVPPDSTADPNCQTFSADEVRRYESQLARELYAAARERLVAMRAGSAPKAAFAEIARFIDLARQPKMSHQPFSR